MGTVAFCLQSCAFSFLYRRSCCSAPPKKVLKLLLFAPAKFRLRLWLVACKVMRFPSGAEVVVVLPPPTKKVGVVVVAGDGEGRAGFLLAKLCFSLLVRK